MSKGNRYSAQFKAEVALESFQHDTTIEEVRRRHGISKTTLNKWRKKFKNNLGAVFANDKKTKQPEESVDELKRIIGELTVQLEILKKTRLLA